MVLKYNALVGKENQARIEALAKELGLYIDKIEERRKTASISQKVIVVHGESLGLEELDRRLIRFPSIVRKYE